MSNISRRDGLFLGGILVALVLFTAFMVIQGDDGDNLNTQATFGSTAVMIYSEADSTSQLLGSMAQGTVAVLALSADGQWLQVPFRDSAGWVNINSVVVVGELD